MLLNFSVSDVGYYYCGVIVNFINVRLGGIIICVWGKCCIFKFNVIDWYLIGYCR